MIFRQIRFRFSLRLLLLVMTSVGLFYGVWEYNRERSLAEVQAAFPGEISIVAPFLFHSNQNFNSTLRDSYCVWGFGYVIQLPFVSERPNPKPGFRSMVVPRIIIYSEEEEMPIGNY